MTLVQQPIRRRGAHSNRCGRGCLLQEFVSAEGLGREGRLRAESPAVARPAGQWAQSAAAARSAGGARWGRLGPRRGARGAPLYIRKPRAAPRNVQRRTRWCPGTLSQPGVTATVVSVSAVVSDFSYLPFSPLRNLMAKPRKQKPC